MQQEEVNAQALRYAPEVKIDYCDDDIVIIDNVRLLAEPSPARIQMNTVALCMSGRAQVEVNGRIVPIEQNQILLCPPYVNLSGIMMSPDFEFKALFLSNRILQSFLREKISIWNDLLYVHKHNVVTLPLTDSEFFNHFYMMLRLYIDTPVEHTPYRTEVIQSLLRSGILGLCGALHEVLSTAEEAQAGTQERGAAFSASQTLFKHFLELLSQAPIRHRPVSEYASQLCISPKYLSSVCKQTSGKTANEWITEYVLEDIRYQLLSTDHSMKEIANQLGFPNSSFFGKYVKEHFGLSPKAFREQNSK